MGFEIEKGVLTCYKKEKGVTEVVIPDTVTSIGKSAFEGCSSLTSVTIPDSVTSIGERAFKRCSSLTSVTIPDSVTSIGYGAFADCSSLTCVTIPNSVTSIVWNAFSDCSSLTSITIPDSVTSIEIEVFKGCSSLTSVTIPDSVKSIVGSAFKDCSSLTSVTIPDSVKSIGYSAFSGCSKLTSVTIPDSVTSIGKSAFKGCSSLTSVTIPDSVTSIGDSAFEDCSSLTSVTIPDSVTSIGEYAFNGCRKLTSVTIPDSVTSIVSEVFSGLTVIIKNISVYCSDYDKDFCNALVQKIVSGESITAEFLKEAKDTKTKYPVFLHLCRKGQEDCLEYVKKNVVKFGKAAIDKGSIAELKEFESYGFITKSNVDKLTEYAIKNEKQDKEMIIYLLKLNENIGKFELEDLDNYFDKVNGDTELTALILDIKNKYFTADDIEKMEMDKMEKELGLKERTLTEWKKFIRLLLMVTEGT